MIVDSVNPTKIVMRIPLKYHYCIQWVPLIHGIYANFESWNPGLEYEGERCFPCPCHFKLTIQVKDAMKQITL